MKLRSTLVVLICLLSIAVLSHSDSPPANTIPIISMKTGQGSTCDDITLDNLCMLLWNNFDGIWVEGWLTGHVATPAELCDSTGATMVLAPSRLQALNNVPSTRWGRYTPANIDSVNAFIHPDTMDFKLVADSSTADSILSLIEDRCEDLHDQVSGYSCIWYYDIFNEAPARQLSSMLNDTSSVDDYFPSMFTQDTMMTEVLPSGLFSWEKWKSDELYGEDEPTVSVCHSMLHTLEDDEWAGYGGIHLGNCTTQANSVNAYFDMQALSYDSTSGPYALVNITPERMDLNAYPVRFAGYNWQEDNDSITALGSATDLWMLEHYELHMDSTFIPAGDHESGPFPINYHPQAFGWTGGEAVWEVISIPTPDTTIAYKPYGYRIPSPAEFRMLCNIGLLRGAKGVFPYAIRSNSSWKDDTLLCHNTGLLDEDLIAFDAPYEDWVYRERPSSDFFYAPPDSIPPWTAADGSQFDPLYSLPSRPILAPNDPKNHEYYLEWKFAAYARLWNSVRRTFGQIAQVAPELSRLWWWYSGNRYDNATITYNNATEPDYFADPHVRVFTDSTESTCYLFYVNRFCRANDNPFKVRVNAATFPSYVDFSEYALDHSRRCLIEGDSTGLVFYEFLDTLDVGEARLLEMFDGSLDTDIRITDPDIFIILPCDGDTLADNASPVGTSFDIYAWVYNMGTESADSVKVYLEDITADSTLLDSVYLSFDGLSTSSLYQTDRALASFNTITPDASNIGVNIYRVYADRVPDEPDPTDNSASVVYMVRPRDYATEVLEDPWDMNAPTPPISPPLWKTFDIDSLTGSWGLYTDSITGMFEGALSQPTRTNALYLNLGSGRDDWIDADSFHVFTMAARCNLASQVTVHWIDSSNDTSYTVLVDTLTGTAVDFGPYDLAEINPLFWTGDIKRFWLEFTAYSGNVNNNVRIGWVKLTE